MREFIVTNCLIPGHYFTDQHFLHVATDAYLSKFHDSEDAPEFNCSKGFSWLFKQRNRCASRRAHYRRTDSRGNLRDLQRERDWIAEVGTIMRTTPLERIINADETSWRVYPTGLRTWSERGADAVAIGIAGNAKD
jgi:hypothetical protein